MPQILTGRSMAEAADAALRYELVEEQAHALGRAGKRVEQALAALSAHPGGEGRAALLHDAADAVWGFLVQREVLGLRDRAAIVAQYGIPAEVLNRIGAR
ncbi:DUF6665 family protein [Phenylobacterium sp. J367]|uniref:DUF6665 family protein n=1 Tax=Phenylobacterium sp. J367 TaxID=2898435 RepID=UPI0021514EE3|nr:DUF6665 family protein [Phenylobacterium sp. J367]MCR5879013.1 hypothetical protein [Phenylobacterium sp. J367]